MIDYDPAKYPFAEVLARDVFRVPRIDRQHEAMMHRGSRLTYQDNLDLRALMQQMPDDAPFYVLYHRWIAREVAPRFGDRVSYSSHPKMRVHLAGTESVSKFHRDVDVTGRAEQINCYLPFTDAYDGCTLYAETVYDAGDYKPLNLRYGQALFWDGGRLHHGTLANDTPTTRVSCDFRFHSRHPDRVQSPWRDILSDRPPVTAPA
ncbi:hypothetical protein [Xanthomonas euvesicatoria]|uniref:hypothetical protein n=1 Tax=Xanthomonas euvesicatoria TaxID=456327 RepID=UPI001C46FBE7|nr:hypothetical protein [Xanthomonas euvesicatoria]MBV6829923.1 hypothetical protein [Xanthomonas campestris pv. viegasii]